MIFADEFEYLLIVDIMNTFEAFLHIKKEQKCENYLSEKKSIS